MEDDQLSLIQGHLSLTVWILPYEVVCCLDEEDSVLLEPLVASYAGRVPSHVIEPAQTRRRHIKCCTIRMLCYVMLC